MNRKSKAFRIPTDVRHWIQRRLGIKVLLGLALLLGEAVLFYVAGEYLMNGFGIPNTAAIFLGLTLLLLPLTGLPAWLFDFPWQGTVAEIYVSERMVDTSKEGTYARMRMRNETRLILQKPNGGYITRTVPSDGRHYRVGDEVIHVRGLKTLLILRNGGNADGICLVCGLRSPGQRHCPSCGHTIVK